MLVAEAVVWNSAETRDLGIMLVFNDTRFCHHASALPTEQSQHSVA